MDCAEKFHAKVFTHYWEGLTNTEPVSGAEGGSTEKHVRYLTYLTEPQPRVSIRYWEGLTNTEPVSGAEGGSTEKHVRYLTYLTEPQGKIKNVNA